MRFSSLLAVCFVLVTTSGALASGDGVRRHWQEQSVTLQVTPGGGLSPLALLGAVTDAAEAWNEVGAGPELLVDGAFTHVREPKADGVNAVFFVEGKWPWKENEIALTFSHVRSGDGRIVEVDVAINAAHHRFGGDPTSFDLQNVLTHELGHALGLPHLEEDAEATMYPSINHGEVKKRDLEHIDESALLSLYEGIDVSGPAYGCSSTQVGDALPVAGFALLAFFLPRRRRRGVRPARTP